MTKRELGSRLLAAIVFAGSLCVASAGRADTWRGTAPFCEGECLPGEVEIAQSTSGDGASCWTGHKVLCRNSQPTCHAAQTKTACYGVFMICDNGYYSIPDVWNSCSKYLCGGCIGFDW